MKLSFNNILNELGITDHTIDRVDERIFNSDLKTQISYKLGNQWHKKEIGYYTIPPDIMSKIIKNVKFITDNVDNVIKRLSFGVFLHKFSLKEILNNTELFDIDDRNEIKGLINYHNGILGIADNDTNSSGSSFIAIVSENTLITTYFTDAHNKEKLYSKLVSKNKNLIVLDSPEELEYYYYSNDHNIDAIH